MTWNMVLYGLLGVILWPAVILVVATLVEGIYQLAQKFGGTK